jgi:anti-sigma factor RsiW
MTEPHERADLLADLDAGLLEPTRAAEVRAAAAQDPDAAAVLAALATTRAELGELADPPVPADYAARWDAALAAEPARNAPRVRPLPRVRPALVAAVVLAATAVAGLLWFPREPVPASLDGVDLVTAGLAVRGDFDAGELADPAVRAGCLRAVAPDLPPDALLLGGRDVVLDGRAGVLLLLSTGGPGHLHIVVVAPGCRQEGGTLLRAQTIGG